ncbi:uncharacterized protein LOC131597700 [Vicia villosa]|uniref:uncharacterized protein LOC131597700 n=1 Tax=Vicia villosa TaxID=3911 RepID=UPI00273C34D9|nr:uncharacterized protein LOC131597700 [Vicia villosa]
MEICDDNFNRPILTRSQVQYIVNDYYSNIKSKQVTVGKEYTSTKIKWQPPNRYWVKLNSDGANSYGYVAGYRGIIRDDRGGCKGGFSKFLGNCSTEKAELWGIFAGLSLAKDLGCNKVEVNMDFIKTIEMIKSGKDMNMDSYTLVKQIMELMRWFKDIKLVHTFREANRCVDALAKFGAASGNFSLFEHEVPTFIKHLLETNWLGTSIVRRTLL